MFEATPWGRYHNSNRVYGYVALAIIIINIIIRIIRLLLLVLLLYIYNNAYGSLRSFRALGLFGSGYRSQGLHRAAPERSRDRLLARIREFPKIRGYLRVPLKSSDKSAIKAP